MSRSASTTIMGFVLTSILLLGACSGDDDSSAPEVPEAQDASVDALTEELVDDTRMDAEDARCIATEVVVGAGVEDATSIDELPDLDTDTAEEIADGIDDCVGLAEFFVATLAGISEISDDDLECARGVIDDDFVRLVLVADMTGAEEPPPEFSDGMAALASECPEVIAALGAQAEMEFEPVGPAVTN